MILDTAASMSVISETQLRATLGDVTLEDSNVSLKAYSGHQVPIIGQTSVNVEFGGLQKSLPLVVAKSNKEALLGRNWLGFIKPEWENLF